MVFLQLLYSLDNMYTYQRTVNFLLELSQGGETVIIRSSQLHQEHPVAMYEPNREVLLQKVQWEEWRFFGCLYQEFVTCLWTRPTDLFYFFKFFPLFFLTSDHYFTKNLDKSFLKPLVHDSCSKFFFKTWNRSNLHSQWVSPSISQLPQTDWPHPSATHWEWQGHCARGFRGEGMVHTSTGPTTLSRKSTVNSRRREEEVTVLKWFEAVKQEKKMHRQYLLFRMKASYPSCSMFLFYGSTSCQEGHTTARNYERICFLEYQIRAEKNCRNYFSRAPKKSAHILSGNFSAINSRFEQGCHSTGKQGKSGIFGISSFFFLHVTLGTAFVRD